MLTFGSALLATALAAQSIAVTSGAASLRIASAMTGAWQTTLSGNIDETLKFYPQTSKGYGRFSLRKARGGRTLETIEGLWRLHRNPLLPITSRWQVELVWKDLNWGEQKRALAIRHLSQEKLLLGNIYLDRQNVVYRRVN